MFKSNIRETEKKSDEIDFLRNFIVRGTHWQSVVEGFLGVLIDKPETELTAKEKTNIETYNRQVAAHIVNGISGKN